MGADGRACGAGGPAAAAAERQDQIRGAVGGDGGTGDGVAGGRQGQVAGRQGGAGRRDGVAARRQLAAVDRRQRHRPARQVGAAADHQAAVAGGGRHADHQAAGRLAVAAGDVDRAVHQQGRPIVHHAVAADIDPVVQHHDAAHEAQIGPGIGDDATRQGAGGAVGAARDHQVVGRQVGDVAADGAAVGQGAQGAGAGDVQRRSAAGRVGQGTRDVQGVESPADIVVARHGQQVAAAGAAVGRQAGQAADHCGAAVAGTRAALDQGDAVADDVVAGGADTGVHNAAGDHRCIADAQHMTGNGKRAGRLAVGARHTDVAGQADAGTAVGHGVAGGDNGVAQADRTGCEHHIAAGVADGAAGEHTHRAVGPTGDAEITRRQVGDIARDGAAVSQGAQGAGAGDVQRRGAAGRVGQCAGHVQRVQAGADVIVARDRQQVAAADRALGVQTGQAADHRGPAVVGAVAALDQGDAVTHQVVAHAGDAGADRAA
ncbi:major ampullate spidroin-like protein [Nitrospirillum viridazoti Y2]|nr:major ampullate spidroin-like protein [Nitrospirillum amazonense Y2]